MSAPPPSRETRASAETGRGNGAILLAVVVAVTIGVTVFVSTSGTGAPRAGDPATAIAGDVDAATTLTAPEPHETEPSATTVPTTTVPTTTVPTTTVPATTLPATTVPATTLPATTTPGTHPRIHPRTRAEEVGLEGNPYGP